MLRAPKGLEGVIVTETSITKIDGRAGRLIYRGYDVTELAKAMRFEGVVHLLWKRKLPNIPEIDRMQRKSVHFRIPLHLFFEAHDQAQTLFQY